MIILTGDGNPAALKAECHSLLYRQVRVCMVEGRHDDKLWTHTKKSRQEYTM